MRIDIPALIHRATDSATATANWHAAGAASQHAVARGERLADLASTHRVSSIAIAAANPLHIRDLGAPLVAGDQLVIPQDTGARLQPYIVQPGETLGHLAARAGITPQLLMLDNGLAAGARVGAGDQLLLPEDPQVREFIARLAIGVASAFDNPGLLDIIDTFRAGLSPEEQVAYDASLQALRQDTRITLLDENGNPLNDPAMRDMVLRGMLAATFGRPDVLAQTLDNAAAQNIAAGGTGIIPIHVHPKGQNPPPTLSPYYASTDPLAAVATMDGGIAIEMGFFYDMLGGGENPFTHEFGHVMQIPATLVDAYPFDDQPFPPGFPATQVMVDYQTDLANGAVDFGVDTNNIHNIENFPLLLNRFVYHPELLQANYPEVYAAFVAYFGYDTLA